MRPASSIPTTQQTNCQPNELRSLCRHINGTIHVHKRYSLHNEKLLRTLEVLHQQMIQLTQEYGQLIFEFPDKEFRINGTLMLPLLTPEQHNTIIQLFSRISVRSLIFTTRSTLRDLSRLFMYLFEEHCPDYNLPSYTKLVSQLPSIQLSPKTSVAHTTQQLRTWAGDMQIIEERYGVSGEDVIEQMAPSHPTKQNSHLPLTATASSNPKSHEAHTPRTRSLSQQETQIATSTPSNIPAMIFQREPTVRLQTEHTNTQPQAASNHHPIQVTQSSHSKPSSNPPLLLEPMQREATLRIPTDIPPPSKPAASAASIEGSPFEATSPTQLQQWFAQAREEQTGSALEQLTLRCEQSLPFGLIELKNLSTPQQREAHIAALLQMLEHADSANREKGLRHALSHLDQLPDVETQEFCFSICRQYVPELLESYIFQNLSAIRYEDLRIRLFRQAVACDTPRLRRMLHQQLQSNALAYDSVQEEWLLRYLHRTQALNALAFLQQRISDPHTELHIRNSSIWMLGAFPNATSLTMLEHILMSSCPDYIQPEHWQTLQLQAIHTLSRFPLDDARPFLSHIKHKMPTFLQIHVYEILREPPPHTEFLAQQSIEASRRRFVSKLWLAGTIGLFLSLGVLATLYFSGWFRFILPP